MTGLALGRALGCLVAARLAARHGITVRLRAGETDGVAAYVILPRHLLVDEPAAPLTTGFEGAPVDAAEAVERSDTWGSPAEDEPAVDEPLVVERAEPAPAPALLRDALPGRSTFDAGLKALLDSEEASPLVEPPLAATADPPVADVALQRRIPGATTEAIPAPVEAPAQRRSPDEVRALLSRFRSGLQAGRATDPLAEEERS